MKAVIQRASDASVTVDNEIIAGINFGLVVFVGINYTDSEDDVYKLSNKILELRIFNDSMNKTNFNIQQVKGEILLVSQFTLCAETKKGIRPSFVNDMEPNEAKKLNEKTRQWKEEGKQGWKNSTVDAEMARAKKAAAAQKAQRALVLRT